MKLNQRVKIVLASLDLGLAEDFVDFLGNIISEDLEDSTKLIFRTQEDTKVDDKICFPLQGEEFGLDDPFRPSIPDDTHPNCRCFWEDAETGELIGQDGIFANPKYGSVTATVEDGKEGSWKTINGTPVFFPDGEDPKGVIDKAFKDKPKTPTKPKEHKSLVNPEGDLLEHGLEENMSVEELKSSSQRNVRNIKDHQDSIRRDVKGLIDDDFRTKGMNSHDMEHALDETFDPHKISYSENLEFEHTDEELKGMWQELGDEHQDVRDRFVEIERGTVRGNEETRQLFDKSPTFFRGTDTNELDGYLDDGLVGSKKFEFEDPDEPFTHKFDFTAVSPHKEISDHYGDGVTIEFEGDSVRKHGTPVTYDHFWRDFGARSESVDGGMHTKYMDHNEVRMPTSIPLDDLKIEKIQISKWALDASFTEQDAIDKYSKLGKVVIVE